MVRRNEFRDARSCSAAAAAAAAVLLLSLLPQMRSCSLVTEFFSFPLFLLVCFRALDAIFPLIPLCLCDRPQGLFTKLLMGTGSECTSNGLYCFTGTPGEDAFQVYDPNADDKWSSLYGVDTRYGGGAGVAGALPPPLACCTLFFRTNCHGTTE